MLINKKLPRYLGIIFGVLALCIMSFIFYYGLSDARGSTGIAIGIFIAWIVTPITGLIFGVLGYSIGIVIRAINDPIYRERSSYPIAIIMIIIVLIIIIRVAIFFYTLPEVPLQK